MADSTNYYEEALALRRHALIEALEKSPAKFINQPTKSDPKYSIRIKFKGGDHCGEPK